MFIQFKKDREAHFGEIKKDEYGRVKVFIKEREGRRIYYLARNTTGHSTANLYGGNVKPLYIEDSIKNHYYSKKSFNGYSWIESKAVEEVDPENNADALSYMVADKDI